MYDFILICLSLFEFLAPHNSTYFCPFCYGGHIHEELKRFVA